MVYNLITKRGIWADFILKYINDLTYFLSTIIETTKNLWVGCHSLHYYLL